SQLTALDAPKNRALNSLVGRYAVAAVFSHGSQVLPYTVNVISRCYMGSCNVLYLIAKPVQIPRQPNIFLNFSPL
ncbi:MAG TPA: hypothetical protein VEI52_17735, partial [Terriglobales bacterium]|nr:hypothetical protein [Terriglobales bacterium]